MSWYGTHPHRAISKTLAREYLPPGACKLCVYRLRVATNGTPSGSIMARRLEGNTCTGCGVRWPEQLDGVGLRTYREDPTRWGRGFKMPLTELRIRR